MPFVLLSIWKQSSVQCWYLVNMFCNNMQLFKQHGGEWGYFYTDVRFYWGKKIGAVKTPENCVSWVKKVVLWWWRHLKYVFWIKSISISRYLIIYYSLPRKKNIIGLTFFLESIYFHILWFSLSFSVCVSDLDSANEILSVAWNDSFPF